MGVGKDSVASPALLKSSVAGWDCVMNEHDEIRGLRLTQPMAVGDSKIQSDRMLPEKRRGDNPP